MHWTERQLKEDNTIEFLEQMHVFMAERANAEKMEHMSQKIHTPSKGRR